MPKGDIKEDIIEILFAIYKIPGEFAIASIISFGFWNAMKELTGWSIFFLLFGIFFAGLELSTPFLAGWDIYKQFFKKD